MTLWLLFEFVKYNPARNITHTHFVSDKKLEDSKFCTFWNFPVTLYCNTLEKYMTIHVFLSILHPALGRYCKMQILWSFQGFRPLQTKKKKAKYYWGHH